MIDTSYFREYRQKLGFTNKNNAKDFLAGKDITPNIDWKYIDDLNERIFSILKRMNNIVDKSISQFDIETFKEKYLDEPYRILKESNMISVLNNQGRRPEQVYFSWMRGYIVSEYFIEALERIFDVEFGDIKLVGDDDLRDIQTFKRTPKADLEVKIKDGTEIRLEIQSGFTGTNDIKQHKVLEAKRVYESQGKKTLAIHFDIYNGQVAFVPLDTIEENDQNWITRQQMEGQTVFNINQNYFVWKLLEEPLSYTQILERINE